MLRLFGRDQRILIVALDHTVIRREPVPGLLDFAGTIRKIRTAEPDAFMVGTGSIARYADEYGPSAVIATIDHSPGSIDHAVEGAVRSGADAVKCYVFPYRDGEMAAHVARIAYDADRWGMPLIAEPFPGGIDAKEAWTPAAIAASARLCAEAGADVIKSLYTGDPQSMRTVVEYASVPVVVLGGAMANTLADLFQMVYDAVVVAGCVGAAVGKNIFGSDDPASVVRGLMAIIHDGATPQEALGAAASSST